MSRIGNLPVKLLEGVDVKIQNNVLFVKGAKGQLEQAFEPEVEFEITKDEVLVKKTRETLRARGLHGLYRNLLANMISGVTRGFEKKLIINGVGYRAEAQGNNLLFSLGYSTQIEYEAAPDIKLSAPDNTTVIVSGIDKAKVGQVASEIRSLRPPEPYKGKGIRYSDEVVRRKVGKSGVK